MPENNDPNSATSAFGGFKFNTTGREEAAAQVLKPQVDSATKMKYAIVAVFVIIGLVIGAYITFKRTNVNPLAKPVNDRPFEQPPMQVPD